MQETQGIPGGGLSASIAGGKTKKSQKPKGIFSSIFSKKLPAKAAAVKVPDLRESPELVRQKKNAKEAKQTADVLPDTEPKKKTAKPKLEKNETRVDLVPQVPVLDLRKEKKDLAEIRDKPDAGQIPEKKATASVKETAASWTIVDQRKNKDKGDKAEQVGNKSQTEANKTKARPEPELTITLNNDQKNDSLVPGAAERTEPQRFADVLARHIEDSSQEIVKTAQVVLGEGDTGTIRLRLEPEALGNVKIELKLAEKKISGTIVVESDLVQSAFKDSYAALRDAFNSQGFELTQLDIDVRNGNGGQNGQGEKTPFFAEGLRMIDRAVPDAEERSVWTSGSGTSVNLVI